MSRSDYTVINRRLSEAYLRRTRELLPTSVPEVLHSAEETLNCHVQLPCGWKIEVTYQVKAIGYQTFFGNSYATHLVLPEGLETIEKSGI